MVEHRDHRDGLVVVEQVEGVRSQKEGVRSQKEGVRSQELC